MFGLINSFSSGGSSYVENRSSPANSANESAAASTNDSTTVLPLGHSRNGNSLDDSQINEDAKNASFSYISSFSDNSSKYSAADTMNSTISSRGIDSLNSRNGSLSRDSSASRHSGRGESSSREELLISAGSFEDMTAENSDGVHVPMHNSNFLSLTDDSTLTASCHSSFGNFQMEEDTKTTETQTLDRSIKPDLAVEPMEVTKQSVNSRRFSEGASPWESSTQLPYRNKSNTLEETNEMDVGDYHGYGFNFSSYSTNQTLPEESQSEEEARTESTTLEDVLDSLLALPSASRSPSPSGGPHPLSLARPYTPHSFISSDSKQETDFQATSSRSSFLSSEQKTTPDQRTTPYQKSFCSSTSTFESTTPKEAYEPARQSSRTSRRSIEKEEEDKSSVTFYLGKDEGEMKEAKKEMARRTSVETGISGEKKGNISSSFPSVSVKGQDITGNKEAKVTFHLPHVTDSSSESANGSENLKSDVEDDDDAPSTSDPVSLMVQCRSNLCNNSGTVEEAKETFKTCHNCSVFYCSRYCRRVHWDKHKKTCQKIRASTVAMNIIDKFKVNSQFLESMSTVARRGFLSTGRGAVKIYFSDTEAAEKFLSEDRMPTAHYQPLHNIMPQEMGSEIYKKVIEHCRNYNADIKFILYVSICTFSETPSGSTSKSRRETIAKCVKLRLINSTIVHSSPKTKPEHHVIARDFGNEPQTLVLTRIAESNCKLPIGQSRDIAFKNIVRELQERGVNLKLQHGDVYRKLSHYVNVGGPFPPLAIYPKKECSFMCIIMPEPDLVRLNRISSGSNVKTIDISKPHPPVT